ncbi:unnamed protein product [Owenia fusiformis]|uniref:Uncharacterized protein n=1 Tax=Owenia fusiformis TaxID=6347 RepID=A0A8J1Y6C2_OWEFU|nr:unnamed protein product [Owenia fusiformis]
MSVSKSLLVFAFVLSFCEGVLSQCNCAVDPDNTICEAGCTYYIYCQSGTDVTVQCPVGQVVDVEVGGCDDPENVAPPCGVYRNCTGKADGYYTNYDDACLSYHYCLNEQFQANNLCPAGLVYDEPRQLCNWPENTCPPCGDGSEDPFEPCPTSTAATTTITIRP